MALRAHAPGVGASTSSDSSTSTASSAQEAPANELEALGYKKKQIKRLKPEAQSEIVKHHIALVAHGFTHEDTSAG